MNAKPRCKLLQLLMVLGAALLATVPAFAQSTGNVTVIAPAQRAEGASGRTLHRLGWL